MSLHEREKFGGAKVAESVFVIAVGLLRNTLEFLDWTSCVEKVVDS